MNASPPVPDLIRDQIRRGRTVRIRVGGYSMLPLIGPGARLTVAPWPPEGPRVGDIAAIRVRDHAVFHLVYHVEQGATGTVLHTRGLASLNADPPTHEPDWVGRVIRVEWGPFSVATDHPAFRACRLAGERIGPVLGLARRAYLRVVERFGRLAP